MHLNNESSGIHKFFFVQMSPVIGRPVFGKCEHTALFEKQTGEDLQNLYNLMEINTLNLECYATIAKRREEHDMLIMKHRWNRLVFVITFAYLQLLFAYVYLLILVVGNTP
jgi:hypothetical protein